MYLTLYLLEDAKREMVPGKVKKVVFSFLFYGMINGNLKYCSLRQERWQLGLFTANKTAII